MKRFNQFISEASFESSDLAKIDPRTKGHTFSVGFAMLPMRAFQNNTNRMAFMYNYDRKDGWFRKIEGVGEGYGLMLRSVKLSTKKMPIVWGNGSFSLYPVNTTYLPGEYDEDDPTKYVKAQMTMFINRDIDYSAKPEDVIAYCNKNKNNWIP